MKKQLSEKLEELKEIENAVVLHSENEDFKKEKITKIDKLKNITCLLFIVFFVLALLLPHFVWVMISGVFLTLGIVLAEVNNGNDDEIREETILLNKEQIEYFYKPLLDFFGKDELAEEMSLNYEDGEPEDRDMGDLSLVMYLYEEAISEAGKKELKEENIKKISSFFEGS